MSAWLARLVAAMVGHPRRALLAALAVVAASAAGASMLAPASSENLLARGGSSVARASAALTRSFGGEPILVAIQGPLTTTTLSSADLPRVYSLEQRIARVAGVLSVFGPGSLVAQTASEIHHVISGELQVPAQRAQAAATAAMAAARRRGLSSTQVEFIGIQARIAALGPLGQQYESLLLKYNYIGAPGLTGGTFAKALVIGPSGAPKRQFAWLFPDRDHALIIVRLRSGLSDPRVRAIGDRIGAIVKATPVAGAHLLVAGTPLVEAALSSELSSELLRLAPVVVLVLVAALLLALRLRRSLHLIVPPLGAVLLTAGLSELLGLGLTPSTVAALPVVLGLGVDYTVQMQARYWHERPLHPAATNAAVATARRLGPTLLLAGGAMILGFLVLTLSAVPLVGRLGLTLALGVVACLASALVFTPLLLVARDRVEAEPLRLPRPRRVIHLTGRSRVAAAVVACGLAVAGLAVSGGAQVQSDLTKLAPAGMSQLRAVETLSREIGSAGDLTIAIHAPDVTTPAVLTWINRLATRVLALDHRITPGPNLAAILAIGGGPTPNRADIRRLLALLPRDLVAGVLSPDHTEAALTFGVPLLSVAAQAAIVDRVAPLLRGAPAGVKAAPGGLLALSAAGVRGLQGERPWLLLLAALVVFLALLAVRRRADRALVPIVPALLAGGLVALWVAVTGTQLSPLSAGLDPLVLAVGTEFGLLLEARYYEARLGAATPAEAAAIAAELVGAPVLVAALTVGLGFAVLIVSRFAVLQQFGLLAAIELLLCAGGAILIVPGLSASLDRRRGMRLRRQRERVRAARRSASPAARASSPVGVP